MTNPVPADRIESIVGAPRHPTQHYGRAVSAEGNVYVLHSRACVDSTSDLRTCSYSLALDNGTDPDEWPQDTPVRLRAFRVGGKWFLTADRLNNPDNPRSFDDLLRAAFEAGCARAYAVSHPAYHPAPLPPPFHEWRRAAFPLPEPDDEPWRTPDDVRDAMGFPTTEGTDQ